jgi:hypothetical protein
MRVAPWIWMLLGGCTGSAAPLDAPTPPADVPGTDAPGLDAGSSIAPSCADAHGVEVCSGIADPTALGDGIEPVAAGIVPGDPGHHWYCRPGAGVSFNGQLVLHLVGTYSDPEGDHRFAERACSLGWAAIAPMYENRDMARGTCGQDAACYEGFHVEVVDGIDRSPVNVDANDSVLNRARTLLAALVAGDPGFSGWSALATELSGTDWPSVLVSGHSQGSGHALYVAREHATLRLVMLAGPADQLRDGMPDHAPPPWILELASRTATPVDRFFAYMHRDDSLENVAQVFANWDAMGLGAACDYALAGGYDAACRRVLIPSDGCGGLNAHTTVVSRGWGPMCRIGGAGFDNVATWAFLLR